MNCLAAETLVQKMEEGLGTQGEVLKAKRARILRHGRKNSWLEVVLDEGKNRHIRRLLEELGVDVLRLIRIRIGKLELGNLQKGQVRALSAQEVAGLF